MRKPVLPLSVLLTAVCLTLTACGGVDKNAYIRSVSNVQADQQNFANGEATKMAEADKVSGYSSGLRAIAKTAADNAKKLGTIEVPSEVTDDHKRYVALYENYAKELDAVAADMDRILGTGEKVDSQDVETLRARAVEIDSKKASDEQKIVNDINTKLQG